MLAALNLPLKGGGRKPERSEGERVGVNSTPQWTPSLILPLSGGGNGEFSFAYQEMNDVV